MNNKLINIIMIDDHEIIRDAYKKLLESTDLFKVIAEYGDGLSAIENARSMNPDIILVDMNMTPINGFAVTENIIRQDPTMKIIGLSVKNQPVYAKHMLQLGAKGYLTKTSPIEEITTGILEVFNGNTYICKEISLQMETQENDVND